MTFDLAFDRLLGHEGSLSLDPNDPGNWTGGSIGVGELRGSKYGISAKSYPALDIAALTIDESRELYKRDFWSRIHADSLPDGVAFQLFDYAVNSGVETAIRHFQRALGVADDGHWGPVSQAAADAMSESDQILRLNGERLDFMTRLNNWPSAGRGWARRIAANLRYGAIDS
jgi:lysozyme family protein